MKYWGVNRVYTYSFATFGDEWDNMKAEKKDKIHMQVRKKGVRFYKEAASGKRYSPYLLIRMMFFVRKMIMKKYDDDASLDKKYWIEKGWYKGEKSPFKC